MRMLDIHRITFKSMGTPSYSNPYNWLFFRDPIKFAAKYKIDKYPILIRAEDLSADRRKHVENIHKSGKHYYAS